MRLDRSLAPADGFTVLAEAETARSYVHREDLFPDVLTDAWSGSHPSA